MKELLSHIGTNAGESSLMLKSMSDKLFHISEIIELQQRFMGELGTENMTQLKNVIEASVTIFDESFNKRGFKINTKLDEKVPEVLVDSSMLTQVFINFIKNSIEAMRTENDKTKKYALNISLNAEERDDKNYAVIKISDNGPGIPDNIKEKMFDFGFSTKKEKNSSSRGIGLHFCMDSVKKYGGFVDVDTEIGKGSCFTICIPIN